MSTEACIFCRNNDMTDECWHSVEYEPVARALAVACTGDAEPTDEQVGWYVDDAENIGSDLWDYLGRETPLACRALGSLRRQPELFAVIFNDRLIVNMQTSEMGDCDTCLVADLTPEATR